MSEGKQEILDEQEIEALNKRQSIPAIKMLRGRLGLGLREAKGITDKYRREHNLLTDFEKDERKIAVHDQLVEALKSDYRFLEIVATDAAQKDNPAQEAISEHVEEIRAVLKAAEEKV